MANTQAWFKEDDYLASKLAQLIAAGETQYETTADVKEAIEAAGFTTFDHFEQYNGVEQTSPNALFNVEYYLQAKAEQLGGEATAEQVAEAIAAAGLTPWTHFQTYGWAEGVNPSAEFDINDYFEQKLADLIEAGDTTYENVDDVKDAFAAAGIDPIAHYEAFGKTEGLEPRPVTDTGTGTLTEALEAYEAAKAEVTTAQEELSAALVAADDDAGTVYGVTFDEADEEYTGFDADADYVAIAEGEVLAAKVALNEARTDPNGTGSDAAVNAAVVTAQKTVNDSTAKFDENGVLVPNPATATVPLYTAAQLQARAANAQAKYEANVQANGGSPDLATELKDAISLYENAQGTPNPALTALTTAIDAYETAVDAAGNDADALLTAEATFLAAAGTAFDNTVAEDGTAPLASGTRADVVESLLTTLNARNDLLVDWRGDATASPVVVGKQAAFVSAEATVFPGADDVTLTEALAAQAEREALKQDVLDAEAAFDAISTAVENYNSAVGAAAEAEEALGYTVINIDSDSVLATAGEEDLFIFDANVAEDAGLSADIFVNGMESGDVVFLFGGYAQGDGEGDNNALEFFVTEVDGNAVVQIENSPFGSNDGTDGDFTTITLTGVTAADLSIDGAIISFA